MADTELGYLGATELVDAMARGQVSAIELAQDAIARIERHDKLINAVCVRDFDRALAAARQADKARASGSTGPLLGVPMTVKESFQVAGLPTNWGVPALRDFVSDTDALAVARVKAAGAVVLGKTNVPFALGDMQTYNDIYGTTGNPWDPARTCGGSSGGSAAALAAGYGALSLGSDIGGSLRNPAHYCGIYAHKPTLGLLPLRGHTPPPLPQVPIDNDLAVIGPMARSAADLALLLDVVAQPEELTTGLAYRLSLPAPRHARLAGHRVLVLDAHPLLPTSASVRTAIEEFATKLVDSGVTVMRHSPLLPDLAEAARLYMRMLMSELGAGFPPKIYDGIRDKAARLAADDHSLEAERTRGAVLSRRDWVQDNTERALHRQHWRELFTEFDVVVCPVMPTPAYPHDHSAMSSRRITIDGAGHHYLDQMALAGIATLPGLPATALPIGHSSDGLPIGIQAIGPMYSDRTTIRFAGLAEREFGGFTPPPLH